MNKLDKVFHRRLHVGVGGKDDVASLVPHGGVGHVGQLQTGRVGHALLGRLIQGGVGVPPSCTVASNAPC